MNDLYWFNPDNEMSIANGNANYTLPANIAAMAADLSFLPAYLADEGDHVLVSHPVPPEFLRRFRDIFHRNIHPVLPADLPTLSPRCVLPWGWSPRAHRVLQPAIDKASHEFRQSPVATWDDTRRHLYSRLRALDCLQALCQHTDLFPADQLPVACTSIDEVRRLVLQKALVVKAPWSSSGRGVLMLDQGRPTRKAEEIIGGMLRKQGIVVAETRFRRLLDFAMEFQITPGGQARYLGLSVFQTSDTGDYLCNHVEAQALLLRRVSDLLPHPAVLDDIRDTLLAILPTLYGNRYEGPLGVDMMIYTGLDNLPRVHPCVEINPRYNMGILALRLARHLAPGSTATFSLRFSPHPGELHHALAIRQTTHPLHFDGSLLHQGYLPLTPVTPSTRFLAELVIVSC